MVKKSQGNQGIQADKVEAEVIAVGNKAQAVKNVYASGGNDDVLAALLTQLKEALQAVPAEARADAEVVDELAAELVEKAKSDNPNRRVLEIKGESLKQAAGAMKPGAPAVFTVATQLVSHLLSLAT